jgi:hypothetical protein
MAQHFGAKITADTITPYQKPYQSYQKWRAAVAQRKCDEKINQKNPEAGYLKF